MAGDEFNEKLCDEKHKGVEEKHCDVLRRVEILETYKDAQINKKDERNNSMLLFVLGALINMVAIAATVLTSYLGRHP
jgi:hypothetical protein